MDPTKTVTLRNGSTHLAMLVAVYSVSIDSLLRPLFEPPAEDASIEDLRDGVQNSLALYELNAKCNDPDHRYFSKDLTDRLRGLQLIEDDGSVVPLVRDLILSMIEWPDADIRTLRVLRPVVAVS